MSTSSLEIAPLPPWGSAVAGATGAILANALVYPLDIVKTRLQVQVKKRPGSAGESLTVNHVHYDSTMDAVRKIIDDEGIAGLYSGMAGSLIGVGSTNFAYFYWYSVVRTLYHKMQTTPGPAGTVAELSLGAVAGAIAQVFTIPVAVITTRQQTQPKGEKKGILETGREVIDSEDGWSGLWRGLKASLVLVVNPAITYGAYSRLREVIFPGRLSLKPWEAFVLGAISKSLATITTQPLIVAKVGLQSRPPPAREGKPFRSFNEVMAYIIEHEGVMGLFKGIGPQLVKGLLVQGILMMTKERMELLFVFLFAYIRMVRDRKLKQAAEKLKVGADEASRTAADAAAQIKSRTMPVAEDIAEQIKNTTFPSPKDVAESLRSRAMPVAENILEKAKNVLPVGEK